MPGAAEWQVVVESRDNVGEGPCWDAAAGTLLWVDIYGRRIQRYDPDRGTTWTRHLDRMVGAVVPRTAGGLALCLQDGLWLTDSDDGEARHVVPVEADDEVTRINDAKVDAAGRLWAGTMAIDERPEAGALYRIDPDGTLTTIAERSTISNGIDWSLDGSLMYYIDSPTYRMDVFDFDVSTGAALNRRPFIHFDESGGVPDGMSVDIEGGLWVAVHDGWSVCRYTPEGRLDRRIELPTARITSCAFGGPDLTDLYVTCATNGLSDAELAEQPLAGALFVIEPGVAGRPTNTFAG